MKEGRIRSLSVQEQASATRSLEARSAGAELVARLHHSETDALLELFRRAIVLHDQHAWTTLYERYVRLLLFWLRRHPAAALMSVEDRQVIVNEAFTLFARNVTAQRFADFATLAALLAYLKQCTYGSLLDECRVRQGWQWEVSLEAMGEAPQADEMANTIVEHLWQEQVWHTIGEALFDEQEQVVGRLLLQEGVPPRDILLAYPDLFESRQAIYNVHRAIVARLRRNHSILALFDRRRSYRDEIARLAASLST